jgi:hypothetical protein
MPHKPARTPRLALKATVGEDSPVHGCSWVLPTKLDDGTWKPGAWNRVAGVIEYRRRGLHVCGPEQVTFWKNHLKGRKMKVWVCEYRGQVSVGLHGWAAREVRLLRPWRGEALD